MKLINIDDVEVSISAWVSHVMPLKATSTPGPFKRFILCSTLCSSLMVHGIFFNKVYMFRCGKFTLTPSCRVKQSVCNKYVWPLDLDDFQYVLLVFLSCLKVLWQVLISLLFNQLIDIFDRLHNGYCIWDPEVGREWTNSPTTLHIF